MRKLIQLTKWEFRVQNNINNLTKYLFAFFLFCTFSIALINQQVDIRKFGIVFSVICLPLSLISFSQLIFKQDLEDGSLELLLSNFSSQEIIVAKFLSVFSSAIISSLFNIPIIFIIFDLSWQLLLVLFVILFLLLLLASGLLILIGAIQGYFRSNTNFLSILIMPLLIPNIIMSGLVLQNAQYLSLVFVMLGINIIILPLALYLSCYLVKNIFNI